MIRVQNTVEGKESFEKLIILVAHMFHDLTQASLPVHQVHRKTPRQDFESLEISTLKIETVICKVNLETSFDCQMFIACPCNNQWTAMRRTPPHLSPHYGFWWCLRTTRRTEGLPTTKHNASEPKRMRHLLNSSSTGKLRPIQCSSPDDCSDRRCCPHPASCSFPQVFEYIVRMARTLKEFHSARGARFAVCISLLILGLPRHSLTVWHDSLCDSRTICSFESYVY